jgi:hypothetical protein
MPKRGPSGLAYFNVWMPVPVDTDLGGKMAEHATVERLDKSKPASREIRSRFEKLVDRR